MRSLPHGLFLGIVLYPSLCIAQSNIVAFYPVAAARTRAQVNEAKLSITCQAQPGDQHVAFIGLEKNTVFLAALSREKLQDTKGIWINPRFLSPGQSGPKVRTWAHVFDRNGDGKVDYLSYLLGTFAVKGGQIPPDSKLPKLDRPMSKEQFAIVLQNMRLVFAHVADDNFDGKPDGMVVAAEDLETQWLDGWIAVRSADFSGTLDECWYFKEDIAVRTSTCERSDRGYRLAGRSLGGLEENALGMLGVYSRILSAFNEAAAACRLTKDSFYRQ